MIKKVKQEVNFYFAIVRLKQVENWMRVRLLEGSVQEAISQMANHIL